MAKRESKYQSELIKRIEDRFPGCFIMKNDEQYRQGTPDLTVLHNDRWAVLEVKRSEDEPKQPNQDYYVEELNKMGYAAFVHPSNEAEVMDALQRTFEAGG